MSEALTGPENSGRTHEVFGFRFVTLNPNAIGDRGALVRTLFHEAYHFNSQSLGTSSLQHARLHGFSLYVGQFQGSLSLLNFPTTAGGRLDLSRPVPFYMPDGSVR